ncbi:MAG: hypothetical protein GWN58_19605, partial [Anaerolineae bacterium]|nr:hypothetical protein [Anaerolineae bacterium]
CGECGAPRPTVLAPAEVVEDAQTGATGEPQPSPLPEHRPAGGTDSDTVWRVAAAVLGVVGVLVCLLGVVAFLLFGLIEAEDMTPAENWLLSTICCLLPIAGTGVAIAVAGLVIWWAKLRNR